MSDTNGRFKWSITTQEVQIFSYNSLFCKGESLPGERKERSKPNYTIPTLEKRRSWLVSNWTVNVKDRMKWPETQRHGDNVIPPWERRIHPDGTPYYIFVGKVQDKEGKDQTFQAVTECVLGLKDLEEAASELYRRYQREVKNSESHPPYQNFRIFLTRLESGTSGHRSSQPNGNRYSDFLEIAYYFVNFDWNQIFWCEDEANKVRLYKLPEMNSWGEFLLASYVRHEIPSHCRSEQRLSTRFLQHLGLFPNLCPPKIEIANFLRSSLAMSAALTGQCLQNRWLLRLFEVTYIILPVGIDDKIAFKRSLRIDSETCTEILELLNKISEGESQGKITEGELSSFWRFYFFNAWKTTEKLGQPATIQHWFDNDGYLNWFLGTVLEDLISRCLLKAIFFF